MDNTKNLRIVFTGDTSSVVAAFDAVQNKSTQTQSKVGSFSKTLDSLGSKAQQVGGQLSSLGGTMTTGFTLPIVGIGIASAKMAMDFQQAMTYVRTDAGDTSDDITKLSQSVLDLAKTSQFTPDQLANGLYHLASLGLRGADALNALNTAQQMASVGGADLESTASALGGALVTGIQGVQDYSQAAGTLDAIIGAGNMRMQDLVSAIGTGVLPVFKNAGLSITDFGAAVATMTDNTTSAEEASTRLRMTIALMESPSKKAQGVLESLGMTSTQMAMDLRTKGLVPALADLKQHLLDTYGTTDLGKTKMTQALTEIFGGGRSSAAAQTLIDQLDRVQSKYTQIADQTGEFSNKVAEQQETASARVKTAWSNIQVDMIELGSKVLPMLADDFTALTQDVSGLVKWWDGLTEAQQHDIETIGKILIVTGPLLTVFGKLASTFGTIMKLGSFGAGIFGNMFGGLMGASSSAAGLAGLTAEAGSAGEATLGLGAILTGPVGVAILGTVAAAGLAYFAYKKWTDDGIKPAQKQLTDFNQLAKDFNYTVQGTPAKVDLVTLAQTHLKDSQNLLGLAVQNVTDWTNKNNDALAANKQAADDVRSAQDAVTAAADKYGKNSPQYRDAVQKLSDKEQTLYEKQLDQWNISVSLADAESKRQKALDELNTAVSDAAAIQDRLNKGLDSGNTIIAQWGPTALGQVNAIDTLQLHVSNAISSFSILTDTIQGSSPLLAKTLQGIGSTIDRVQGQDLSLNNAIQRTSTLQVGIGSAIQGSTGGLQANASGTDYAPGGWSLVGEEGPEIIQLPRGSQVLDADKTKQAAAGHKVEISINYQGRGQFTQTDAVSMARQIVRALRSQGLNLNEMAALR